MALLYFDGFDRYSTATDIDALGSPLVAGAVTIETTEVPHAYGQSLQFPNVTNSYVRLNTGSLDGDTIIMGGAFRFENATAETKVMAVQSTESQTDSGTQLGLYYRPITNDLQLRRAFNDVITTGPSTVPLDTWVYIELKFKIHNTTGVYAVQLNGASYISEATSQDTQRAATSEVLAVVWGSGDGSLAAVPTFLDNIYVLDTASTPNNSYLGDIQIKTLLPTGDNSVAWTKSGGANNYLLVDEEETHDGDTTYVSSSTLNQKDLYDMGNLPSTPASIYGIKVVTVAKKTDTGSRNLDNIISHSGTEQAGTHTMAESYTRHEDIFETSDGTTTAWTETSLNAALVGIEVET